VISDIPQPANQEADKGETMTHRNLAILGILAGLLIALGLCDLARGGTLESIAVGPPEMPGIEALQPFHEPDECHPANGIRTMDIKECDRCSDYVLPENTLFVERNLIRHYAESGAICEVFGHWWRPEQIHSMTSQVCYGNGGFIISCPIPQIRKCKICERREKLTKVPASETWEEIKP
jgi:hypothetical protein